jgi:hypothetical protein
MKPGMWKRCGLPLAVVFFVGALSAGCEKGEVSLIYDEDEIKRYINEAPDESELFRVEGLIPDTPYRLPFDSAVYRDLVDSVVRTIDVQIAGPFNFGYLGYTNEALATVTDRFYLHTQRILGNDTLLLPNERELKRYGYFLLLGDENDLFLGWKLWGFSSLGQYDAPVELSVTTLDGKHSLPANLTDYPHELMAFDSVAYIRLIEVDTLQDKDSLRLAVSPRGGNTFGYYHLVSAVGDDGYFMETMTRIDDWRWVDTIKTPANNPRLWNILYVQTFLNPREEEYVGQFVRSWCIPYYTPR